jgi:hypothetical protein
MTREDVSVGDWWYEYSTFHGYWIVTERGSLDVATDVTVAYVRDEPRAKQLCREHNAHARLVEACEAWLKTHREDCHSYSPDELMDQTRAAVEAAKGGGK